MAEREPGTRNPRKKLLRYGVPVAVVAVTVAAGVGLPALANTGDPDLPRISAEKLVAKIAESDVQRMSGTLKVNTDLGLPALPGSGGGGGGMFGGGSHGGPERDGERDGDERGEERDASPQNQLARLASGEHTLRFAVDGPERQRLSVVEDTAEYSVIRNKRELWAYDSASNSAWHTTAPKGAGASPHGPDGKVPDRAALERMTPQESAKAALKALDGKAAVSVDGTARIADRDAYQLVLTPRGASDSTVGEIRVAVDAEKGVPLKFTVTPKSGGKAIVDLAYTKVDFGTPEARTFEFTPPKGASVEEKKPKDAPGQHGEGETLPGLPGLAERGAGGGPEVLGDGWDAVVRVDLGENPLKGGGLPGRGGADGDAEGGPRLDKLVNSVTEKVRGDFGDGRVFSTRLVNVLLTDDGQVYAGAVTKEGLVKAANAAK
ncbi:DUF2092 domain-containing protein [Streptomyces sp. AJS327]|uniref:LolA family protein n=1 Tax=Streptomyces sp. AJS327 TaxID=2545265 RepID=UPI0015DD6FEE|nr:DUF2092 domain-containing protein [Streptomyces sp. AJS327]MBA0054014.1 DUF2092 domain-containing protein [Streptomyces sp. AJS327]